MVQTVRLFKIFLASPSDTKSERESMVDIIEELNHIFSSKNIKLELVKWETHAVPSIGEDSQQVITESIGDDYDIFIGIFWKDFGTPTKKADSGTEEEFNVALDKHKRNPGKIEILFYFKQDPIPPNEIDAESIKKINDFKERLKSEGVLYANYVGVQNFGPLLRVHLAKTIDKLESKMRDGDSNQDEIESSNLPSTVENNESEELGIYEYIENAEESLVQITEATTRMNEILKIEGDKIAERTKDIRNLGKTGRTRDNREKKRIINRIPHNLNNMSNGIKQELDVIRESFNIFTESTSKAFSILVEMNVNKDNADVVKLLNSLSQISPHLIKRIDQLKTMHDVIVGLPRLTRELNISKANAAKVLADAIKVYQNAIDVVSELLIGIQKT